MVMKIVKCKYCQNEFEVNSHASNNFVCCDCKKEHKIGRKSICRLCGNTILYKTGGCSNDFCKKHSIQQIKTLVQYFGFNENVIGTPDVETEFYRIHDILYKDYWIDNLSSTEICKKYNYPNVGNLTSKVFKYLNIPSKNCSDINLQHWLDGTFNSDNNIHTLQQWYTTWNNKEVYLRSSYELDFAKELDKNKIDYDVECLRIKYFDTQTNKYRCAIPDFYLPETNTIVEIKSDYTYNQQNMKDKFAAYKNLGYNCKLILEHKEIEI